MSDTLHNSQKNKVPNEKIITRIFCETVEESLKADALIEMFDLYTLQELEELVDKRKKELGLILTV